MSRSRESIQSTVLRKAPTSSANRAAPANAIKVPGIEMVTMAFSLSRSLCLEYRFALSRRVSPRSVEPRKLDADERLRAAYMAVATFLEPRLDGIVAAVGDRLREEIP